MATSNFSENCMSNPEKLRSALEAFLGPEDYRKFLPGGARVFWQEKLWEKFIAANPEFDLPSDEIRAILQICPLHGLELLPGTVELFHGCLDYSSQYMREKREFFPYAAQDPISTEGIASKENTAPVRYCPECRNVRNQRRMRRV